MRDGRPNPGSEEAREQGCVCPVLDNAHGRRPEGWTWWYINMDCSLHASESTVEGESQQPG